jgi:hypothetical protein
MAFAGYLLKVNSTIFPHKYIKIETYKITPNQTQDDNSYEDGDGLLHRDVLPHKRSKLEFVTPQIHEADNRIIQALFPDTLTVSIELWNPRKGIYETATCYTPDTTFEIYKTTDTDIIYNPLRIAFIEY